MRDYTLVANTMERIIYKYIEIESMKREYGTGILFTQSEIHIIECIGDHEGINITELAKQKRKTKGAISQMIYKLVDKGIVEKNVSKNSDAEVALTLTDMGRKAYEGHRQFHKNACHEVFETLKNMSEESYGDLVNLLKYFENFLDQRIEEK